MMQKINPRGERLVKVFILGFVSCFVSFNQSVLMGEKKKSNNEG
jgi:hypothetical protein